MVVDQVTVLAPEVIKRDITALVLVVLFLVLGNAQDCMNLSPSKGVAVTSNLSICKIQNTFAE